MSARTIKEAASNYSRESGFSESQSPFVTTIPKDWRERRLKAVARVRFSSVDKKTEEGEALVKLCNYTDVYKNEFIVPDMDFMVASANRSEISRFALEEGDVLVTKDSESWNDIAVPALVTASMPDVLCGYHLAHIRPDERYLSGRYLARVFAADGIRQQFHIAANGITRFGLPNRALSNAIIPVPPLGQQIAIAEFLDKRTEQIDALITKKERLIALLKKKRQAKIAKALTKGLHSNVEQKPSGVDWIGMIPRHWEVVPIGYASRSQGGSTPSKENIGFWNGDIPWVSPKDMKVDVIDDSIDHVTEDALSETTLKLIHPPVVLVVVRGMILAHTFPVGLTSRPVTINQDMKAIRPVKRLQAEYLSWLLRSISPTFFAIVEESGHGTRVLRTDLWSKQKIFVPPLSEQKEIVDYVLKTNESINSLIGKVSLAISKLRSLRSALVTAAVTGRIDITSYRGGAQCQ